MSRGHDDRIPYASELAFLSEEGADVPGRKEIALKTDGVFFVG